VITPPILTDEDVRSIAEASNLPESWLQRRDDGTVLLDVPPDASYESANRLLSALRKYVPPLDFVGNERSNHKPPVDTP